MRYDEFVTKVLDRGEYADREETERVVLAVLSVLARRLDSGEVKNLASQLPGGAAGALISGQGRVEPFDVREFLGRVAAATGASGQTAEWDASAVLSTVAEAITGGELNNVLTQLPSGYAVLFGKPALGG